MQYNFPTGGLSAPLHPESISDTQTGFLPDTEIVTSDGLLPVAHLMPGDWLLTRNAGFVELKSIFRKSAMTRLIRVQAGSFATTQSQKDTLLPADQVLHLRDWRAAAFTGKQQALMRAADLVDGCYVSDLGADLVDLCFLTLARESIIYAGGLEIALGEMPVSANLPVI